MFSIVAASSSAPIGSEGESVSLGDSTTVGRTAGGVFQSDLYLSPRHATLYFEGEQPLRPVENMVKLLKKNAGKNAAAAVQKQLTAAELLAGVK